MALGIFLQGAVGYFMSPSTVRWFVFGYLLLVLILYLSLFRQLFQAGFLRSQWNNPLHSFVLGSWIAGLSVTGLVIENYLPSFHEIVFGMSIINSLLYIVFFVICIKNFTVIGKHPHAHAVHGIVLLSAVATQSLVLLWSHVYTDVPAMVTEGMFWAGFCFYLIGLTLIIVRYGKKGWSLTNDWTNANCIIHGGLSITGLAAVSTEILSVEVLAYYWWVVLVVFLFIEGVELIRAAARVRTNGWKNGVFSYHISQWSRNFTFGMFYAFTAAMQAAVSIPEGFSYVYEEVLPVWAWLVFIVLVGETAAWCASKTSTWKSVL